MIKRYGGSVSPCSTPATMSKYSVSPSGEQPGKYTKHLQPEDDEKPQEHVLKENK